MTNQLQRMRSMQSYRCSRYQVYAGEVGGRLQGTQMEVWNSGKYVTRALRVAKRAKYNILVQNRNIEQIMTALEEVSSEEDLTDFTTALCLYNLRATEDEDSHKILQFINQSQDALGSKFGTDYEMIKKLIIDLVNALGTTDLSLPTYSMVVIHL